MPPALLSAPLNLAGPRKFSTRPLRTTLAFMVSGKVISRRSSFRPEIL
jgi:hypothetical protein